MGGADRTDNDLLQRERHFQSFFMSQTPITQAQWRVVAEWREREGDRWGQALNPAPSQFRKGLGMSDEAFTEPLPVEQVSWYDAMEFCERLSQRTGRLYTLPSEMQWEYACRAGTSTLFAFGDDLSCSQANCLGPATPKNDSTDRPGLQTTKVTAYPANGWGLHDMHGNVWEWCLDQWHPSQGEFYQSGILWLAAGNRHAEQDRVLRGGAWTQPPEACQSASRFKARPITRTSDIGFRVVCIHHG